MIHKYRHTSFACYLGYVTQALVITLPTLLFTVFYNKFNISFSELGVLIIANFFVQLVMDITSTLFIKKTGYRPPTVAAHFFAFLGFVLLSFLPNIMVNHRYAGVCIPIFISSVGGGLIEVVISPIMESIPNEKKSASMSLLHSFFCWGQLATVALSTLYFYLFGIEKWYFVPLIWSLIPLFNMFYFLKVEIPEIPKEEKTTTIFQLLKTEHFPIFLFVMLCSGAAELSMSQWASMFAETGLGVSKTMGDLLGPSLFALFMGISRVYYGIKGEGEHLLKLLICSGIVCIASYFVTVFSPVPVLSLAGCAVCGLSVGIMWPGTFSLASERFKGGTTMFALLAFAGDIGCSLGPGLVGIMSDLFRKGNTNLPFFTGDIAQQGLKFGIMIAAIFPVALVIFACRLKAASKKEN